MPPLISLRAVDVDFIKLIVFMYGLRRQTYSFMEMDGVFTSDDVGNGGAAGGFACWLGSLGLGCHRDWVQVS